MGCSSYSFTLAWSAGSPTSSSCGDRSYYVAQDTTTNAIPVGQNRVRIRIPIVTTHDLLVDFIQNPPLEERCFTWLANTGFDITMDTHDYDRTWSLAFRDSGNNPLWLLGQTVQVDFSNLPSQSDCQAAGTVIPPPPVAPPPTGFPPAPTFTCATIPDICAALTSMQQKLEIVRGYTQLLQRWGKPFGYLRGATYANLSGQGSVPISRLLGMSLNVIARPPGGKVLAGNPPYLWDMGWVTINDANGMLEQLRVTRDSDTWFPDQMPLATSFNWHLEPGVVLTAIETRVEP